MIRKTIRHFSVFAIVVGTIGMSGFSNFDAYALSQLDYEIAIKSTADKCKQKYDNYKILGESEFRIQNIGMVSLNDCTKMYKSPNWKVNYNNAEMLYLELLNIKAKDSLAITKDKNENIESIIEKLYTIGIGKEKYFVKFKICAGSVMEQFPEVSIKADREDKIVKFQKILMPETCRVHEHKVNAKYSESIVLSLVERQSQQIDSI